MERVLIKVFFFFLSAALIYRNQKLIILISSVLSFVLCLTHTLFLSVGRDWKRFWWQSFQRRFGERHIAVRVSSDYSLFFFSAPFTSRSIRVKLIMILNSVNRRFFCQFNIYIYFFLQLCFFYTYSWCQSQLMLCRYRGIKSCRAAFVQTEMYIYGSLEALSNLKEITFCCFCLTFVWLLTAKQQFTTTLINAHGGIWS